MMSLEKRKRYDFVLLIFCDLPKGFVGVARRGFQSARVPVPQGRAGRIGLGARSASAVGRAMRSIASE